MKVCKLANLHICCPAKGADRALAEALPTWCIQAWPGSVHVHLLANAWEQGTHWPVVLANLLAAAEQYPWLQCHLHLAHKPWAPHDANYRSRRNADLRFSAELGAYLYDLRIQLFRTALADPLATHVLCIDADVELPAATACKQLALACDGVCAPLMEYCGGTNALWVETNGSYIEMGPSKWQPVPWPTEAGSDAVPIEVDAVGGVYMVLRNAAAVAVETRRSDVEDAYPTLSHTPEGLSDDGRLGLAWRLHGVPVRLHHGVRARHLT